MRTAIRLGAALFAAIAATSALAAGADQAQQLALPASAFPKGAVAMNAASSVSSAGSGWGATYRFTSGGRPHELLVSVTVWKSRSLAVAMFKQMKSELIPAVPKLKLAGKPYGDEQVANHSVLGGSQLIVRKGSVVWMLEPQTYMVRAGTEYELTRAQTIALYEKYGRLQQRRIG
ncbi:MAG TPA: hypothetical protein VIA10_14210 [Gaiellaceae bacterium]|jgi:hypothetical protein